MRTEEGENDHPPPPGRKKVGPRTDLVEMKPKTEAKQPEKGSGGVEHTKKGESTEMEKELRVMKRRAEVEVEEGEGEKKKEKDGEGEG